MTTTCFNNTHHPFSIFKQAVDEDKSLMKTQSSYYTGISIIKFASEQNAKNIKFVSEICDFKL